MLNLIILLHMQNIKFCKVIQFSLNIEYRIKPFGKHFCAQIIFLAKGYIQTKLKTRKEPLA
jgi:hypothetical protein